MTALPKWLTGLPWLELIKFTGEFLRGRIKWALVTCATLLVLAGAAGYYYFIRVREFEEVVQATLGTELEPTPQYYKGLESFLVSTLEGHPEEDIKAAEFNAEFVRILENVSDTLRGLEATHEEAKRSRSNQQTTSSATTPGASIVKVEPPVILRPTENSNVLTDSDNTEDEQASFLFVPIHILRPTLTSKQLSELKPGQRSPVIDGALDDDLRRDIIFTDLLLPALRDLARQGVTKTGPSPEQVYLITKNGVNRIVGSTANTTPYNFPETTFFPMRPYFWPVFDRKDPREARKIEQIAPSAGGRVGQYFKVSRPYMDLGGSGFVITLSRGLRIDGFPMAVLCIDVPIGSKDELQAQLRDRVRQFDGHTVLVNCQMADATGKTRPGCEVQDAFDTPPAVRNALLADMAETLDDAQQKNRRADVFGNILRLKHANSVSSTTSSTPPHQHSSALHASVPLQALGENKGQFLLLELDLGNYRRRVTFVGAVACTAVGLTTLLLAYLWGTKVREYQNYHNAFSRVADVMAESPTPYVRLTATDHIADFSGSFLELLGFYASEADRLKAVTFESLVAEESRDKYREVQENRKSGRAVPSYEIKLQRRDGGVETVRIVSAAIPSQHPGALPETFGILIRRTGNVVPFDLVAAARHANQASP